MMPDNLFELIGVSEDIGTVEAGKHADLIAVQANPLDDILQLESIPFVVQAGVIVKNETGR